MKSILSLLVFSTLSVVATAQNFTFDQALPITSTDKDIYTAGDTLSDNEGKVILTDAAGNIYSVGNFRGTTDFDPGTGVFELTSNDFYDVYAQKCNDMDHNFSCHPISFAQQKITFFDQKTSKAIYFVQVFSLSNELLSISDINGQIILNDLNNDELIAKHLDYKPVKFRPRLNDTVFLQSFTQELGEVIIKPFNKRNLLRTIVENSKQKMPKENFYGKLNLKGFYAQILPDSTSINSSEKWDTSIYFVDIDVNFQYLFSKNLNNCKLLISPVVAKIEYMSNKNGKIIENSALSIFTFFAYQDFSFYNDLLTDNHYYNFLKRKYKTSKTGVDLIKTERKDSKKQFEASINFNPSDTTLISYKSLRKKITNNNIRYENTRLIDYGLGSNNHYFLIASKLSHYALTICDEVEYRYLDLKLGTNPAITDSISLSNYLKNVIPTIIPYRSGILSKRYYELFKGKTSYDFQDHRKEGLEEMKNSEDENEE